MNWVEAEMFGHWAWDVLRKMSSFDGEAGWSLALSLGGGEAEAERIVNSRLVESWGREVVTAIAMRSRPRASAVASEMESSPCFEAMARVGYVEACHD